MTQLHVKVTNESDVPITGCVRCDTAMLPAGAWPEAGEAQLSCPLCGWEQPVLVGEEGEPFNPAEQREDAKGTPLYQAASIEVEEDLVLVEIPGLLEEGAFYALQDGVAPVREFGWVGGEGILGAPGYRLILVVRVDLDEQNLFRVEFPPERVAQLTLITADRTLVLVSEQKGIFFPEASEIYLQAVTEAGGKPGFPLPVNEWATLEG